MAEQVAAVKLSDSWEWQVNAMNLVNIPGTAARIIKDTLEESPNNNGNLHYKLAEIASSNWKNFTQAKEQLMLCLKCNPNHAPAHFSLAVLFKQRLNDYQLAQHHFQKCIEIDGKWGPALKEYADLLAFRMEKQRESIDVYKKACALKHGSLWNACNNAATVLKGLGEYEESEKFYLQSISVHRSSIAFANLGVLYWKHMKRDTDAEAAFRESIKIDERQKGAHTFLGQMLARHVEDDNKIEEAKKELIRALELGDERGRLTLEEIILRERNEQRKNGDELSAEGKQDEGKPGVQDMRVTADEKTIFMVDQPSHSVMGWTAEDKSSSILACGDMSAKITLLNPMQAPFEPLLFFQRKEGGDCNDIQFSNDGKWMAAVVRQNNQSTLYVFDISTLRNAVNAKAINGCNTPVFRKIFESSVNTNAMQFSGDGKELFLGFSIRYPTENPFVALDVESGKVNLKIYTDVLIKQCDIGINSQEGITAVCVSDQGPNTPELCTVGTIKGNVWVITTKEKRLIHRYAHRSRAITSLYYSDSGKWIVSGDAEGTLQFWFITMESDIVLSKLKEGEDVSAKRKELATKPDKVKGFKFVEEVTDAHFGSINELEGRGNLVSVVSRDGNMTVFELTDSNFYTRLPTIRLVTRIESVHEYRSMNTSTFTMTPNGLTLVTGGDDCRILAHTFTDILLEALPEGEGATAHKKKRKEGDPKEVLQTQLVHQQQKTNGWSYLWDFEFGEGDEKKQSAVSEPVSAPMSEKPSPPNADAKQMLSETEDLYQQTSQMVVAALSNLDSLTTPVIAGLKKDKLKYERVFERMQTDPSEIDGQRAIAEIMTECRGKEWWSEDITLLRQPSTDLLQLLTDGKEAHAELQKLSKDVAADPSVSGKYEGDPGLKKVTRSVEKSMIKVMGEHVKKGGSGAFDEPKEVDFSYLKDLARAGVTCKDLKAIARGMRNLMHRQSKGELQILRAKNRFVPRSDLGYRDVLINLRFTNKSSNGIEYQFGGHIVELQLHHEKFQNIRKKGGGHAGYSASRYMMDFIRIKADKELSDANDDSIAFADRPQTRILGRLKDLYQTK